ncbi:MAG: S-methyl-5-thioribose-1-phosphate isomerase, partial [Planctomycetota bacterium]
AERFRAETLAAARRLATSRPTAVNLFWALDRMRRALDRAVERALAGEAFDARRAAELLLEEARAIHREDEELCRAIGRHGARLLEDGSSVLTHCNAGALATGGSGTALAVVYEAVRAGKTIRVYADETRPLLQGARLTSWELRASGIDVTVIADGAAASLLASGRVQAAIVGADRIARNGDVANKIGTLAVAIAARRYGVPFYVAAPRTTFDLDLADGSGIPIEERPEEEVLEVLGLRAAPRGVRAWNPAFDVTPAELVSAIITEKGVLRPPYARSIREALG